MPISVLIAYATRYGTTGEAAEAIAEVLREKGLNADVKPAREVRSLDGYDAVVVGAPLFMFHWHKDAVRFLMRHQKTLPDLKTAVFALGPTHEPHDEQEWKNAHTHLNAELSHFPWFKPVALEVFGGKYDPEKLSFPLSLFAGKTPASDIRDAGKLRTWAEGLVDKL